MIDLALVDFNDLEAFYSELQSKRALREPELRKAIERAGRRAGADIVRRLIDGDLPGFTRSAAERLLRKLCREARLPQPRTNVRLDGVEPDFFWPEHNLIVEVDGYDYHGHRAAFERDRRKDMALVAAGYKVIRVTWRQLNQEPLMVISAIARAM